MSAGAILLCCALFNFVIDPSGVFGTGVVRPLAWSSRAIKADGLVMAKPATLILGSSRAMKIDPGHVEEVLPGKAFNASVDSATPEDHLALYRHAREAGAPVSTVLLALDVESFSVARGVDERLEANISLARHIRGLRGPAWWADRATKLVSFSHTLSSARSFWYLATTDPPPLSSFDDRGFLTYLRAEQQMRARTYDWEKALQASLREYAGRFDGFDAISESRWSRLVELLDDLQTDGVRVFAYLTPLHPRLVAYLQRITPYEERKAELTPRLVEEFGRRGMVFRDASALESFRGTPEAWYDGAHPAEANNRRLVRWLTGGGEAHALQ